MTATFRVGAASSSGGLAYARYLVEASLRETNERAALYYAGEVSPRHVAEPVLELRPDLSAAFAKQLGIDTTRPLTMGEFADLMMNRTAQGDLIAGRKKHSAHQSVASVFGLAEKTLPSVADVEHVLAGRRADGARPRSHIGNQGPLSDERIASAQRALRAAIGVPSEGEVSAESIAKAAAGKIDQHHYYKRITGTAEPIGYIDITFSPDKSVDMAYALEKDPARRALILADTQAATADGMAYLQSVLGVARSGAGGLGETEVAELIWVGVQHYNSRPATDVIRKDAEGREYTDTREVPGEASDVNLHRHMIALSSMRTASGKIRAINLDLLDGEVKVAGAVMHASLATRLKARGADVALGPSGEARVGHFSEAQRAFNSRRKTQGETAAREWAASQGQDWDSLDGEQKIALIGGGVRKTRQAKAKTPDELQSGGRTRDRRITDEGRGDIATWQRENEQAGFRNRSVLNPGRSVRVLTPEQRIDVARNAALPLVAEAFKTRAVIPESALREIAARGLIASGVGQDPVADVAAVMQTFRDRGVKVAGAETGLVFGVDFADGRRTSVVSTGHTLAEETELLALVRKGAADRSGALTVDQIDAAAERVLAANPRIDRQGSQWQAQIAMAHALGEGPCVGLAIGVPGSGKTKSVLAVLTEAWHADGKQVFGMTTPWRAAGELREAGVDHAVAIDAFIKRVEGGKYTIDKDTVIIADEVSMISVRQQLALHRIVDKYGAQIKEIGDPRQIGSVEQPGLDLVVKAIGDDNISKLLTTIRQSTERGRDIATAFRLGNAAEGLMMLREDGRFNLVAGDRDQVIKATVADWRQKIEANRNNPDYSLIVMAPTNANALDIGRAIRANRRRSGELGTAEIVVKTLDPNSKARVDLSLSVGDKIRAFTRLHDADAPGRKKHYLASNGDVVEILKLLPDGLQVRNAEGEEGRVAWSQMKPWRAPKNDPLRISLGYVSTIDAAQSLTRSQFILSMPDGSAPVTGNKACVALSRDVHGGTVIASDAAERKQITARQMLGLGETPRESDVIANLARNLSRFGTRSQATEMRQIEAESIAEGRGIQISSAEQALMMPMVARVIDYARDVKNRVAQAIAGLSPRITQAQRDEGRQMSHGQPQPQYQQEQDRGWEIEM